MSKEPTTPTPLTEQEWADKIFVAMKKDDALIRKMIEHEEALIREVTEDTKVSAGTKKLILEGAAAKIVKSQELLDEIAAGNLAIREKANQIAPQIAAFVTTTSDTIRAQIVNRLLSQLEPKEYLVLAECIRQNAPNGEELAKKFAPAVNDLMFDRGVRIGTQFKYEGKKTSGLSAGGIVSDPSGKLGMKKVAYMHPSSLRGAAGRKHNQDRSDLVTELVAAPIFELLLYNRAPKEQLVILESPPPFLGRPTQAFEPLPASGSSSVQTVGSAPSSAPGLLLESVPTPRPTSSTSQIAIRSKFFDNVQTLYDFLSSAPDAYASRSLQGFEKVIAACNIMMDSDYHTENLMVQEGKTLVKIDHGRALYRGNAIENFKDLVDSLNKHFSYLTYDIGIEESYLSFDVKEYSSALNQMLAQIDEGQLDAVISRQLYSLEKAGFDLGDIVTNSAPEGIKPFDRAREQFSERLKKNIAGMRKAAEQVEIVALLEHPDPNFARGGWVKEIFKSEAVDAISYAITYNGLHSDKQIKIKGEDPLVWAIKNDKMIEGKPALAFVLDKGYAIEGKNPLQWMDDHGYAMPNTEEPSVVLSSTAAGAVGDGAGATASSTTEREDADAPVYPRDKYEQATVAQDAPLHELLFKARMSSEVTRNDAETAVQVFSVISHFTQRSLDKKATETSVTKMYDDVLKKMVDRKYLTTQEVNKLKSSDDYKSHITATVALLNSPDKGATLNKTDMLCYKVAQLLEKYEKLPSITKVLRSRIESRHLEKIKELEKALYDGLKITEQTEAQLTARRQELHAGKVGRLPPVQDTVTIKRLTALGGAIMGKMDRRAPEAGATNRPAGAPARNRRGGHAVR